MNYLYIDYISAAIPWNQLSDDMRMIYDQNYTKQRPQDQSVEEYYGEMAGIHPEYSYLIGLALGYDSPSGEFKTKVIVDGNRDIFPDVAAMLEIFSAYDYHLISWNLDRVRGYLIKKYFKNSSPLPKILKDYRLKPWEQLDINVGAMYKGASMYPVALDVAARYLGYLEPMEINMQTQLPYVPISNEVYDRVANRCLDEIKATKFIYDKIKILI